MGTEAISASAAQPRRRRTVPGCEWLRAHDPGYAALRRATRTALIMPAMFAIGDKVIANPILATFAAFGSFAMLLLVDFSGPIRDRALAQSALVVACAVLICLGTLASRSTVVAALAMAVVGFAILFAGVVSSVLAGATTSLLLAFILPVSLPGPVSSIPDRVAGWGLAGAVSVLAIALLWPSPARDPVRVAAVDACRALAERLRAEIAWMTGLQSGSEEAHQAALAHAEQAVESLQRTFFATPYRPTGLTTAARAVVRLVDELRWLNTIVLRSTLPRRPARPNQAACAVRAAAAEVLSQAADLLERPGASTEDLHAAAEQMRGALASLEMATTSRLPEPDESAADEDQDSEGRRARAVVSALDPSFRAQELSWVVSQVALNTDFAAAAERRSWVERLLGRQPEGLRGPLAAASERAGAHVERNSLWLHNSLRGAAALALAVLVADLSGTQHAFWVVLGTLAVLRSNALNTGQNVLRALLGTTGGFIIGGALVALIGTNTTVLWVLLPIAVLIAGLAPATISFAAGQAAFTVTLLILYNILAPAGWKIGLTRVEDIAIGSAVSLAVGVLFWPRGAGAALGKALSGAYADSARYLAGAVAYGLGRCDDCAPGAPPPREEAVRAAAAARRLDDTYRGYLTERGAKPIPLAGVTGLVTGSAAGTQWPSPPRPSQRESGFLPTLDETQLAAHDEMFDLAAVAQHGTGARWPMMLMLAALPAMRDRERSATYFERGSWHELGAIAIPDAIQLYGHYAWRASADQSCIDIPAADQALPRAQRDFARGLYASRWQSATPVCCHIARASSSRRPGALPACCGLEEPAAGPPRRTRSKGGVCRDDGRCCFHTKRCDGRRFCL